MASSPIAPQQITASWLTEVLGEPIQSVTLVDEHSGTTGRAVVAIAHDSPALPNRLFVKLPPGDEMQKQFVISTGMGKREVQFYQQLSAEVPVRVPHCYHAQSDESGARYIMLLEHLEDSGCTFRNASTHYSKDYLRSVMQAFSRLHAAYWDTPRFTDDLAWVEPLQQNEIARVLVERALHKHADTMPAVFSQIAELYLTHTDAVHALWRRGVPTLIHGDVHDGNIFYAQDQPGLLDWAVLSRGPCMRDVGYFLAGTIQPGDQAAWGRELVRYYRQELITAGVRAAPSESELWQQYQWHAAYVWISSAVTLAMGDEWQPVKYVLAGIERIHSALELLESVDAIREAL